MTLRILTYGQIDREAWRGLVRESGTGTWFQTPEAYAFYASLPQMMKPFAVACERVQETGTVLAGICCGYVTVETNPLRQFFTRRAIIPGGPVLADDAGVEEVSTLMQAVRRQLESAGSFAPIYIETRNFNDYSRWKDAFGSAGFEYKKHLNFHVDCTDEEAMWSRMSDNRRRQVRKAGQGMVTDRVGESEIREWYAVLSELYRTKVRTPLWPVEFFLEAGRSGIATFLMVRHEGKIIGGSMVMRDEKSVYEWYECGLNAAYKDCYPSVTVTFAGMEWAARQGCERYDMMGAGEPDVPYGVRDFKAEFGGRLVEHGRFLCICQPRLYRIGKAALTLLQRKKQLLFL